MAEKRGRDQAERERAAIDEPVIHAEAQVEPEAAAAADKAEADTDADLEIRPRAGNLACALKGREGLSAPLGPSSGATRSPTLVAVLVAIRRGLPESTAVLIRASADGAVGHGQRLLKTERYNRLLDYLESNVGADF